MSRSARAARGFAASVVQFCAQMLLQVLLAPVVLKVAGRETLGAYAAIMQAVGFLTMIDVIGSWSLERFLGQAMGLEDGGARFRGVSFNDGAKCVLGHQRRFRRFGHDLQRVRWKDFFIFRRQLLLRRSMRCMCLPTF